MGLWDQIKEQVSGFNRGTWGTLDDVVGTVGAPRIFEELGAYHPKGTYDPSGGVFGEMAGGMMGTPAHAGSMLLAAGLSAVPQLSQKIMDSHQQELDGITEQQRVIRQSGIPKDAADRQIAALEQKAEGIRAAMRSAFAQLTKVIPK
jgi:hypothetical protein